MPKEIKGPDQDTVAGNNYVYIDCPSSMDECYYDLELISFEYSEQAEKYFATFRVLDTDTKVRKGTEISHTLDPWGKFAKTYFWRDLYTIYLVCRGKEATKEAIQELAAKFVKGKKDPTLKRMEKGKALEGQCTVRLRAYEKDDKRRVNRDWSPLSESDD